MKRQSFNRNLWVFGGFAVLAAVLFSGCAKPYLREVDSGYYLAETESKKVYAAGQVEKAKGLRGKMGHSKRSIWQTTEYEIQPGDIVQVRATGRWTPGRNLIGPEGDEKETFIKSAFPALWIFKLVEPFSAAKSGALIAKLPNGHKIAVERECTIDNTDGSLSGPIAFAANSSSRDAYGSLNVELAVYRPGAGELIAHHDPDAIQVKPRDRDDRIRERESLEEKPGSRRPGPEEEPLVIASREPERTERTELRSAEAERELPGIVQSAPAIPTGGSNWAVVIGIADYENTGSEMASLAYADEDARDFANLLKTQGWSDSRIKIILNRDASKRNIEIALKHWLRKAKPEDVIVLFWSGHGIPDPADPKSLYLACYDTDYRIPTTGYRMDEVRQALEERGCKNVVMLADTCHAGGIIEGQKGLAVRSSYNESWKAQTSAVPKGWIFMGGADSDRKGIENSIWSNGAFTHCLLEGLEGKADGYLSSGLEDGLVTMNELRTYISNTMPEETAKVLNVPLHPIISASTGDPRIWDLTLQTK